MHNRFVKIILLSLTILACLPFQVAHSQTPIVQAVLFFSPSCQQCHIVMEEVLPPLAEKYGNQLDVVGIDVEKDLGLNLYQAAVAKYNVPDERIGVPTLIIGNVVLVGSKEIPEALPGLIEDGIKAGGVGWPEIPGLDQVLAAQPKSPSNQSTISQESIGGNSSQGLSVFIEKFMRDPVANSIAVIVLIGMIAGVFFVGYSYIKATEIRMFKWPSWVILLLSIFGMGVAAYLFYIEITQSQAICGPVGDCNSVQESPYAYLFGVIPVGAMGFVGYLAILVCWLLQHYGPKSMQNWFALAIWGMAWFGILFSIYLTFLEPFVIGATCAWCITSAILMTLILLASTEPAKAALRSEDPSMEDEEENEDSSSFDETRPTEEEPI